MFLIFQLAKIQIPFFEEKYSKTVFRNEIYDKFCIKTGPFRKFANLVENRNFATLIKLVIHPTFRDFLKKRFFTKLVFSTISMIIFICFIPEKEMKACFLTQFVWWPNAFLLDTEKIFQTIL